MKVITQPQSKLDKVIHLLKISKELNILEDTHFDLLMNKSEKNPFMFDYFLENINELIISKISVEITADNFKKLLYIHSYKELMTKDIYIPQQELYYM